MRAYILMNHDLSPMQVVELKNMGCNRISNMSQDVKKVWGNIPPELETVAESFNRVVKWLETAECGDVVVVQGDYGMTFKVVYWCMDHGVIPVYATSKRQVVELGDGTKISKFQHVRFRRYIC